MVEVMSMMDQSWTVRKSLERFFLWNNWDVLNRSGLGGKVDGPYQGRKVAA
jgi:hypothetical protein